MKIRFSSYFAVTLVLTTLGAASAAAAPPKKPAKPAAKTAAKKISLEEADRARREREAFDAEMKRKQEAEENTRLIERQACEVARADIFKSLSDAKEVLLKKKQELNRKKSAEQDLIVSLAAPSQTGICNQKPEAQANACLENLERRKQLSQTMIDNLNKEIDIIDDDLGTMRNFGKSYYTSSPELTLISNGKIIAGLSAKCREVVAQQVAEMGANQNPPATSVGERAAVAKAEPAPQPAAPAKPRVTTGVAGQP
jgi:hypothetical protein